MSTEVRSTPDEESALVHQASVGDLEAFNQLVLRYQDASYHYAYTIMGDTVLAEDVTQESFIKAFRQISNFRGEFFRAWLFKIVRNTAYDFLRQSKRHAVQSLFPEDEYGDEFESPSWIVDQSNSVEEQVEQIEDGRRLYQLLDELPEPYRSVLTLIDINELDYKEVAQILSVPVGTIKSRLARARFQMRGKLLQESRYFNHYELPLSIG